VRRLHGRGKGTRVLSLIVLLCTATTLLTSSVGAQPLPTGFQAAFDSADTRARALTYWLQCVPTIARLRADGRFGAAASAPRFIHCERRDDGVPIGGVFDVDSTFVTVTRLQLVRLDGDRGAWTGAIDTARPATDARLVQAVTKRLGDVWRRLNHPFSAIPIAGADGGHEVWAIPRANRGGMVVTGGDVGFTAGADGTLQVIADRAATWAQVPLPLDGPLDLTSASPFVPAVADLVVARYHAEMGRTVSVRTSAVVSRLVPGIDARTGARVVWEHTAITTGMVVPPGELP
jgi:hypothetical protein